MYLELIAPHQKVRKTNLRKGDKVSFHKESNCFSASRGERRLLFSHNDDKFLTKLPWQEVREIILRFTGRILDLERESEEILFFNVL